MSGNVDRYKTVEKESSDEFSVKRSRFIGYIRPVKTAEEAVKFINEIKSVHWDATHNVYAYVLRDGQTRRYSDDGEPQGTAGIPVLDVLLKEGLTDCAVVVTRYFGGIMLGAGGLVRAYSHAAKIAVDAGGAVTMSLCFTAFVECDYTFYGRLHPLLCENGAIIEDTEFAENVKLYFRVPKEDYDRLNAAVIDAGSGRFACKITGEKYSALG